MIVKEDVKNLATDIIESGLKDPDMGTIIEKTLQLIKLLDGITAGSRPIVPNYGGISLCVV